MSYLLTGGGGKRCYCCFGASRRWGFIICKKVACPSSLQKNDYFTRALRSRHCNSTLNFRAQVAMYARFEAAQQISESVGGNAQHEWVSQKPGQGSARRLAATRRGARGRGQVIPPHRQAPVRDGDQRRFDRGNFRNAIRREAQNAIPPRAMPGADFRPRYDPVQRPFRPQFQRNQRRAFRREANMIEQRPNPLEADSDIGF